MINTNATNTIFLLLLPIFCSTSQISRINPGHAGSPSQGSHSFTDKKIQDFPGPPWKIFQDLFGAHKCLNIKKQETSAKLTNQRISYAFTSSLLSFHARHILPTSKFQHSYSCMFTYFSRHQWQWTACVMCENCECEYSSLVWRFLFG